MPNKKVLVILGPTSSGKSELAVKIAQKFSGEIISADSRQIFQFMSLGTGKVEGIWRKKGNKKIFFYKNIPHYLIDFKKPTASYNVTHFQKDCQKIIQQIAKKKLVPIICGGTGFWISAVVEKKIFPSVKPNPKLRKNLSQLSSEELFRKLKELDFKRATTIDPHNKVRLIRAIEICQSIGQVPPLQKHPSQNNFTKFLLLGISIPLKKLEKKIKKRVIQRIRAGMIEEIIFLHQNLKLSWKKIQSFGLAYFWVPQYILGKISKKQLIERIFLAERNYAKRQMTWFKKNKEIIWIKNTKEAFQKVNQFLKE